MKGFGGGNMNALMKQAQKMQEEIAKKQEEINNTEITSSVSGGLVKVTMNGTFEVVDIKIAPDAVDPDDVEMLEDLVKAGLRDAKEKVEAMKKEKMGQYANMGMPF